MQHLHFVGQCLICEGAVTTVGTIDTLFQLESFCVCTIDNIAIKGLILYIKDTFHVVFVLKNIKPIKAAFSFLSCYQPLLLVHTFLILY